MSLRPSWPKSLRSQFNLALVALTLLIFGSGFIATQTLKETVEISNQLGEERLTRLERSQNIVLLALAIEHEAQLMIMEESIEKMHRSYGQIQERLASLDKLVSELGQEGTGVSILKFQRAAQLFRSTVHVLAGLHDQVLGGGLDTTQRIDLINNLKKFNQNLVQQGAALLSASHDLSNDFSTSYRQSVQQLTIQAEHRRYQTMIVLSISLIMAWLVSGLFLGKLVISRLRQVSHYLRNAGSKTVLESSVPVTGDDEIGEMARAVEQYISERQQLAKAQQEAMLTSRFVAVGQLAAGIAHEINTPSQCIHSNLEFIHGVAQELSKDSACTHWSDDLEETRAAIKDSMDGIKCISNIVMSMKEFSLPTTSSRIESDINRALDNSLNVTHKQWKDIASIDRHYDPDLPKPLCDISKINQVFMNLIINSTQAIEESGKIPGKITITTAHVGDFIEIHISDTGIGIPGEIRDRVFDPFFTTKPVGSCTGQGLAICHDIIASKHGGTIEVSGNKEDGAEIILRLPITPKGGQ